MNCFQRNHAEKSDHHRWQLPRVSASFQLVGKFFLFLVSVYTMVVRSSCIGGEPRKIWLRRKYRLLDHSRKGTLRSMHQQRQTPILLMFRRDAGRHL